MGFLGFYNLYSCKAIISTREASFNKMKTTRSLSSTPKNKKIKKGGEGEYFCFYNLYSYKAIFFTSIEFSYS